MIVLIKQNKKCSKFVYETKNLLVTVEIRKCYEWSSPQNVPSFFKVLLSTYQNKKTNE